MANVYEKLGYEKHEPKPHFTSYSLVKVRGGWVVLKLNFKGTISDMDVAYGPTTRSLAVEQFKLLTAQNLLEAFNE